jgi:hypothetical protein
MVSDEAKEILLKYKNEKNITTLDEALDQYLINSWKSPDEW